jgi:hypothetical protein
MVAGLALLAGAACGPDEVEPLPPMERPSPERRAGLPEIGGRWLFAGWETPPPDSAAEANNVYRLTPPGEIRVLTQRLDSVAGQYGVPGQFVFPFVGEVRRDGVFALLAQGGETGQQFLSGRVVRDTLWMELSNVSAVGTWPPQTRAAFVRRPRGAPFRRLLGGAPIVVPPDSATLDSIRRDSVRQDSLRRAGTPPAAVPGVVPVQPGAVPSQQPGVTRTPIQPSPQPVTRTPIQPAPQPSAGAPPPVVLPPRPQPPRPQPQPPRPRPQAPPPTPPAEPLPTEGPPPPQEFPQPTEPPPPPVRRQ